jgi:hypothetical protein
MQPSTALSISSVTPPSGVPGGEIAISCQGFKPDYSSRVLLGEVEARIVSASDDRIIAQLPESPQSLGLALRVGQAASAVFPFSLATQLATGLHPVANPVIGHDGTVITTISGGRGQQVPQPLVRVNRRGDKFPYACEIMNPTGLAFSKDGQLHISSRNDGTVMRYTDFERLDVIAEDLGVPCGIIFDSEGRLYVGDRTGRIFRIDESGGKEEFAHLEPSVSAYHLAVDAEDRLYVAGPTISMRDCLLRFSKDGKPERLLSGLARPQGMAFLPTGDLLICAAYEGKKGVFKFSPKDRSIDHYIAAPMLVGLAVAEKDIFLATGNSIYWTSVPGNSAVN